MNANQNLVRPPGLIRALTAGFDSIAGQLGLLLFPVALDVLLWLGPRWSVYGLFQPTLQELAAAQLPDAELAGQVEEMFRQYNLLTALRTFPIGIPSLMTVRPEPGSPLGTPQVWEVPDWGVAFGGWLLLTVLGLAGGCMYFLAVAQATDGRGLRWKEVLRRWPWALAQVFFLTLLWFSLLASILFPFGCVLSLFLMNGAGANQAIWLFLVLAGSVLIWLLIPLVFSPHGIFARQLPVWQSIRLGFRLVRMTLAPTTLFLLIVIILMEGLDFLWNTPSGTSWWLAVGILGHAFVSSALLAASFVYYREALNWAESSLKSLRNATA